MYWIMCNFQEAERMFQAVDSESVHLPYERGDVLEIPVKALKYRCDIPTIFNKSLIFLDIFYIVALNNPIL